MIANPGQNSEALPQEPSYEAPAVEALGCWETVTGSPGIPG
ncbi:hypothetical protein PIGHUM_02195 [Pigmentiphaga humi]|uniref:Uncharacterized protein n=1 Tax=Pigmentiphaga humi TaxID=2478468 RepID=A0A3P4B3C3_9BURK|nr:hypothetical protein [Pigmentiphaga humi]VCU70128.1 hypothetical protein PIGHUM_02195 [Pigmentiphaga humi]